MSVIGTEELIALTIILIVHLVGAACLIWPLLDDDARDGLRGWWPGDGGDDRDPEPDQGPSGTPAELPLAETEPSRVRFREPGRIGDQRTRPGRRPEHAPERAPVKAPER